MNDTHPIPHTLSGKLSLNLAIVGGGKASKFFIELFRQGALPHADINIVGVCDINPGAVGIKLAKKLGIGKSSLEQTWNKIWNSFGTTWEQVWNASVFGLEHLE